MFVLPPLNFNHSMGTMTQISISQVSWHKTNFYQKEWVFSFFHMASDESHVRVHFCYWTWLLSVTSLHSSPGSDAIPNDSWYVGGEDHSLVRRTQRHRQVGLMEERCWNQAFEEKLTPLQRCLRCFLFSIQGWGRDGIPKDCPGPWDVWSQLLCHYCECITVLWCILG